LTAPAAVGTVASIRLELGSSLEWWELQESVMNISLEEFQSWMQERLGATDLRLEGWTPTATGYSNETNIFGARFVRDGKQVAKKFVQRLGPADGRTMFREYDLERQCRVVQHIGEHSSLPVPRIVGLELSVARPFYVMEHVAGEVALDGHTADKAYTTTGFLHDATPAQREAYWFDLIRCMAELHRVPVSEEFKTYFQRAPGAELQMRKEVNWWVDLYNWGKGGADVPSPQTDGHIDWICKNVPDFDDDNIVWQDGRPANVIAKDFKIAAMLDWEIAGLGPGEQDLFFHLLMHHMRERQEGAKILDGIPSEAEQIAHYESIVGHKVREPEYFGRFARTRCAIIQIIFCRAMGMELKDINFTGVIDDEAFAGNY